MSSSGSLSQVKSHGCLQCNMLAILIKEWNIRSCLIVPKMTAFTRCKDIKNSFSWWLILVKCLPVKMDILVKKQRKRKKEKEKLWVSTATSDHAFSPTTLPGTWPSVVPVVLPSLVTCFEAGPELSASAGRWEGLQGCLCWQGSIWRSQLFVPRETPPHPACHGQARQTDRLLPNWHLPF